MDFDKEYYEGLYEDFIGELKKVSIEIGEDDIHWRGFYSQGDGLCFDFEVCNQDAINFLMNIDCPFAKGLSLLWENDYISEINIKTHKNVFAHHYSHSKTRNIELTVELLDDDLIQSEQINNAILTVKNREKIIADEIKSWYINICNNLYKQIEEVYEAFIENGEATEEEAYNEQEDITISDKIDSLIDPEMNIEKVVEMIEDAKDLSYTKGESINLIEKFIKNFNDEYIIIKKVK